MTTGADGPPIDESAFRLDLIGVVLEDRYRVESVLGEGGMASVYLATDLRLSRSVVVKVPHTRFLAEKGFRERFSLEISSLVSAEHPSVVKVLDAGVVRGVPYAVLQHLSGGSLHDRLAASRGTMTAAEIDAWLTPVAAALDSVHKKGIVHRDVKPGNILFDGDHNAYLADFGIAKVLAATGGSMTTAGSTVGSPDYMGPELANGEVLTPAYDQYALGVIVYQALSGRLPFEGGTPVQTLVQKATSPPRPLGEVSSGVPSEAVDAVMQSLSVDVEARFPTCSWFAIAFRLASGVPRAREEEVASRVVARAPAVQRAHDPPAAPPAPAAPAAPATTPAPTAPAAPAAPTAAVEVRATLSISAGGPSGAASAGNAAPKRRKALALLLGLALVAGGAWFFWQRSSSGTGEQETDRPRASLAFLAGFAVPVGGASDVGGLPASIRRLKDGATMDLVPAGRFEMGSDGFAKDESPRRSVTLSRPYYVDETEVSIRAYRAYCSATKRPEPHWPIATGLPEEVFIDPYPAHGIDRESALEYAHFVGATLPTEAQWERAAMGGHDDWAFPWGTDAASMPAGTAAEALTSVRGSPKNPYGIFDLAGNVAEWCLDGYDAEAYLHLPSTDPLGPPSERGVARGGSGKALGSASPSERLRVARRLALRASGHYDDVGFRCAFVVP